MTHNKKLLTSVFCLTLFSSVLPRSDYFPLVLMWRKSAKGKEKSPHANSRPIPVWVSTGSKPPVHSVDFNAVVGKTRLRIWAQEIKCMSCGHLKNKSIIKLLIQNRPVYFKQNTVCFPSEPFINSYLFIFSWQLVFIFLKHMYPLSQICNWKVWVCIRAYECNPQRTSKRP